MEDEPKTPAPADPQPRKELTPKNIAFIEHLCSGVPIVEAYYKAGYRSKAHCAYELKRQLAIPLKEALEARGFSIEGLAADINQLASIPVNQEKVKDGVTYEQKIKAIQLKLQALTAIAKARQGPVRNITAFVINRSSQTPQITKDIVDSTQIDGSHESL